MNQESILKSKIRKSIHLRISKALNCVSGKQTEGFFIYGFYNFEELKEGKELYNGILARGQFNKFNVKCNIVLEDAEPFSSIEHLKCLDNDFSIATTDTLKEVGEAGEYNYYEKNGTFSPQFLPIYQAVLDAKPDEIVLLHKNQFFGVVKSNILAFCNVYNSIFIPKV